MPTTTSIPTETPETLRYLDQLQAVREVGLPLFTTAIVQEVHRRTDILPVQLGGLDTPANRRAVRAEAAKILAERLEADIDWLIAEWRSEADRQARLQEQPFLAEAVRHEGYSKGYRYAGFLLSAMVEVTVMLWAFQGGPQSPLTDEHDAEPTPDQ